MKKAVTKPKVECDPYFTFTCSKYLYVDRMCVRGTHRGGEGSRDEGVGGENVRLGLSREYVGTVKRSVR